MSRTCPTCQTAYSDDVSFCGRDGTITIQDQDPFDLEPRLGTQLGGYLVVAHVADGAMGRVFEGRHPVTKARVAIKVLHSDVARDQVAVERFKREYDSALEMDHPNIVKVLEYGQTPDRSYFLTMEYLAGQELSDTFGEDTPFSAARIIRIACQVASALDYAHSFGFIHRDLKPDNIFLCAAEDGDQVRLLDFGSVKLQIETGAKLTAFGTTVGSPFYMSPEQAMGKSDVDGRTDVFALGAIIYEMLTQKVAFDAPNVAMILMRIMHESPDPVSQVNPACPRALDAVVDRALRKERAERCATAGELAGALLRAYGLPAEVERWARAPQANVEAALRGGSSRPQPASDAGRPSPPAAAPTADEPRRRLPAVASTRPSAGAIPGLSRVVGMRATAWIGLALLVAGSLVALLLAR